MSILITIFKMGDLLGWVLKPTSVIELRNDSAHVLFVEMPQRRLNCRNYDFGF